MKPELIYAFIAFAILITAYAIRNKIACNRWETRFKALKVSVLMERDAKRFEELKNEFDALFGAPGHNSEAIHILWKQFIGKYWREYSEFIIKNDK